MINYFTLIIIYKTKVDTIIILIIFGNVTHIITHQMYSLLKKSRINPPPNSSTYIANKNLSGGKSAFPRQLHFLAAVRVSPPPSPN